MRSWGAIAVATSALALAACGGDDGPGPTLKAMTWNVYIGGDVAGLARASTEAELVDAAAALFARVEASDFRDRAAALATEIAQQQPDLVGLQEVALWRTQTPPDGSQAPAGDVALDFLEILLAELDARGAAYSAVAVAEGVDGEVPTPEVDVRFTDRDVILARDGAEIDVVESATGRFATNFAAETPLGPVTVERGWASVTVDVGGSVARFVTTHLEVAPFAGIQLPQAEELISDVLDPDVPTILAGDINSAADGSGTPTYMRLLDAGLNDAWAASNGDAPGLTCCRGGDLANGAPLETRLDVILTSDDIAAVSAAVVGAAESSRSPAGRWPSDHAGVVATLRLP